jgi:hypothetical protein
MNPSIDVGETHSVKRFLKRLVGDLERGCSALVLFPKGEDYDPLWQQVNKHLWQDDYDCSGIWLPELPADGTMPSALGELLGVRWGSAQNLRTVESLAVSEGLPEIIHLRGFDELTDNARGKWLALMRRWADAAKSREAQGWRPTALCMMASASSLPHLPPEDVWLVTRWWWALPSALEMRLLCRHGSDAVGRNLDLETRWREHIMPSLVGNDIGLAHFLWNDLTKDSDYVIERLKKWAAQKGWTIEALSKWKIERESLHTLQKGHVQVAQPSVQQQRLWAQGLLNWTPEYGVMLSAAALVMLQEYQAIKHRLWRGQVRLLLPMIDSVRLSLCQRWTKRYGLDWPWRWQLPRSHEEAEAVRTNPLASGWGHIEFLLRSIEEMRDERTLLPLVSHARYVRNELAHYRPVTFQDFGVLWRRSRV